MGDPRADGVGADGELESDSPDAAKAAGGPWLARLAFVVLATAFVLPWWTVTNTLAGVSTSQAVRFGDADVAWPAATWVTAALLFAALPILFVRLAARSWIHEVDKWRRDLGIAAASAGAALASSWAWPREGLFWGSRTYPMEGGDALQVAQAPGAGWWLAVCATLVLALAWWRQGRDR